MIRQSPKMLVSEAQGGVAKTSWLMKLSELDQKYVFTVVEEMRQTGAGAYKVARLLVKELNIKRSHETVARTLREIINA